MVAKPVPDEYFERYRRVEHGQLYRELRAGSPQRIDALADTWYSVSESLRTTAEAMRADLVELLASWSDEGAREFQYRLGLVAAWTEILSEEAEIMRAGLTAMSGSLAKAQREADPEPTTTSEWSYDPALASVLGLVVTDEQRTQSHDRLVQIVAELSLEYDLTDSRTWSTPRPAPSPDLPGRFVESDLLPDGDAKPDATGTQLAGTLSESMTVTGSPAGIQLSALGAAGATGPSAAIVPARAAVTLGGAGAGLASSASTARLPAPSAGSAVASTGSAGAALPPPVMGAGVAPASTSEPIVTGRGRAFSDDTSWSSDEHGPWTDDTSNPPPILGQSARPA